MLFEPVVQVGLGGVIALRDELLRRAVRQQALDLRPKGIQLALARSPGPAELQSLGLPEAQGFLRPLRDQVPLDLRRYRERQRDDLALDALVELPVALHGVDGIPL